MQQIKPKKRTSDSLFTLLTEGEAKDLAKDFGQITKDENFFGKLCQNLHDKQAMRWVLSSIKHVLVILKLDEG